MQSKRKKIHTLFSIILYLAVCLHPFCVLAHEADPCKKQNAFSRYFKQHEIDIFPVPIFETRPDKGNSYGLMPVVLLSDKQNAIKAILAAIGQYNSVTKADFAGLAYFYPTAEREILFFGEAALAYAREVSFRFYDPHFYKKFYLEYDFQYLKTPFGHFFGIGPDRIEANRTNYTSRNFYSDLTTGYYLLDPIRINLGFRFHTTDLLNRAMEQFDDTLRFYGALPQVVDATNLIEEISAVFDNRANGVYSTKGTLARLAYFFSHKKLGSDQTFQGWNLETIQLFPLLKKRWGLALRFNFQEIFGDGVPFYELSNLGGPGELRAFTPLRFVDQGKILFQMEHRIQVFNWKLFGIPFDMNMDPFFEMGRVFDEISNLGFGHWQPVGGIGFRLFVPPNVVGRVDVAVGRDGMEIYTVLGYPF